MDENAKKEWHDKFVEVVGNDVNTAMGLTLIYDVIKSGLSGATKRAVIDDFDQVLGLKLLEADAADENGQEATPVDAELAARVEAKIEERTKAKKEKNFALADEIRAQLLEEGIVLIDTREGTKWEKK